MTFNKQFVISFAEYFLEAGGGPVYDAFNTFLKKYIKEEEGPEPGIHMQVLEAAAEMCGITLTELQSGKKYGDIPTCKQLASKVLSELKCTEHSINKALPFMGHRGTIHSQIMAAAKYEKTELNFRVCLNQLRERFGLLDPVHNEA